MDGKLTDLKGLTQGELLCLRMLVADCMARHDLPFRELGRLKPDLATLALRLAIPSFDDMCSLMLTDEQYSRARKARTECRTCGYAPCLCDQQ